MYTRQLFTAALAASLVSAQKCDEDLEITTNSENLNCKDNVFEGDITVSSDLGGELSLEGIEEIKGSLIVNGTSISSFSSSSIKSISKDLVFSDCGSLNSITMSALVNVDTIRLEKLQNLPGVSFAPEGLEEISSIIVADTRIDDLTGLNVAKVENFEISNNHRMTSFDSALTNITGDVGLVISDNGQNLELQLSQLESATELQFRGGIKSVKVPRLESLSKGLLLDENDELTTFFAPNLTKVGEAVSFSDNAKLSNVTIPKLETIGGALKIVGNPKMKGVAGLPELTTVGGGVELGGNFEEVELPNLSNVEGSVNVTSTTDIADFCEFFEDAESAGDIQGELKCTSNNEKALEGDADGGDEGSNRSSSNDDDEDAAGIVGVNSAVLGLAVVFGIAQLL